MKVFVSVAERSASNYLQAIFKDFDSVEFFGLTDENLEALGFKSIARYEDISVVGIWEAIPKIPKVLRLYSKIESIAKDMDAFILCDAPAFNIPLLKRIRDIPFEVEFYKKYGKEALFVGHPLTDLAKPTLPEEKVKGLVEWEDYLVILPGSRWSEMKNHGEYIKRAYKALYEKTKLPAVIPTFEPFRRKLEQLFKGLPVKVFSPLDLERPNYNLSFYAKFGLVASGTAELELSLLEVPHVVFYRVNPITYWVGKRLAKVSHIALTNLILKDGVIPEVVQRPWQELVSVALNIDAQRQKEAFARLKTELGGEGSINRLRALFKKLLSS
jgi:lipid-A-disaccharide synthase